jgi:peptide deformylase
VKIVEWPDPILTRVCKPVEVFGPSQKEIADEMHLTMKAAYGIGLAAPQVGLDMRMFVMDVEKPLTIINPEILEQVGRVAVMEGCLSFPDVQAMIGRAAVINVKYQNIEGETIETMFTGLSAVCFQHELDHLNGKTFIEYMSDFKKKAFQNRLKRAKNET